MRALAIATLLLFVSSWFAPVFADPGTRTATVSAVQVARLLVTCDGNLSKCRSRVDELESNEKTFKSDKEILVRANTRLEGDIRKLEDEAKKQIAKVEEDAWSTSDLVLISGAAAGVIGTVAFIAGFVLGHSSNN